MIDDDDPEIIRGRAIAALVTARELFGTLRPLFDEMIAAAKKENVFYLAYAASHLMDSIDVFQQQVDRYVEDRMKAG